MEELQKIVRALSYPVFTRAADIIISTINEIAPATIDDPLYGIHGLRRVTLNHNYETMTAYDDVDIRIIDAYRCLNADGRAEAAKRVEELAQLPQYMLKDDEE